MSIEEKSWSEAPSVSLPPAKNILLPAATAARPERRLLSSAVDHAWVITSYISTLDEPQLWGQPDNSPLTKTILLPAEATVIPALTSERVPTGTSRALTWGRLLLLQALVLIAGLTSISPVSMENKPPASVTFN